MLNYLINFHCVLVQDFCLSKMLAVQVKYVAGVILDWQQKSLKFVAHLLYMLQIKNIQRY